MNEVLESPLSGVYGGVVLGSKAFIKETLGRIQESVFERKEIAEGIHLKRTLECDEVVRAVRSHFQDSPGCGKGKECRDVTIFFLKKYASVTNRQIVELFGDMSYSAVAKAHRRLSVRMSRSRSLKKAISAITTKMSNVKV